jgi:hypothetical protein
MNFAVMKAQKRSYYWLDVLASRTYCPTGSPAFDSRL